MTTQAAPCGSRDDHYRATELITARVDLRTVAGRLGTAAEAPQPSASTPPGSANPTATPPLSPPAAQTALQVGHTRLDSEGCSSRFRHDYARIDVLL